MSPDRVGEIGTDKSSVSHPHRWWIPVTRWTVWQYPRRMVIAYVLAVDVGAVALTTWAYASGRFGTGQLVWFAILMVCGIVYTEMSRPIERVDEHLGGSPHIDLNSVWMFAAALLLPAGPAATVIATSYAYRWWRVRRHIVHRQVFSAAATILAADAAALTLRLISGTSFPRMVRDAPSLGVVVAAGLAFLLINTILVSGAVYASTSGARPRDALGSVGDYSLEAATIGLGILLAWALVAWPAALLLIMGITLAMHRCVLLRQLREQASTDGKTGLLNAEAWNRAARSHLFRAARMIVDTSLLMLDLDHFKAINDRYGHLVGDEVLRIVADTLKAELRRHDLIGRFGGEEFTILLPDTPIDSAFDTAERLRREITDRLTGIAPDASTPAFGLPLPLPATVSIGVAAFPHHADTLDELVHAADTALYHAKANGRNQTSTNPVVLH